MVLEALLCLVMGKCAYCVSSPVTRGNSTDEYTMIGQGSEADSGNHAARYT